jgi:RNA polymerase sigma-70 factor (ECF subfamily)
MLGSMTEAEDAVQEAYLRWHAADRESVDDARAYLTTTTTRICLDVLKSARVRRVKSVGPWLPDPITETASAFLVHDVFDYSFTQVADALGRNEAACRQLASRARTHVRDARPPGSMSVRGAPSVVEEKHAQLLSAFIAASRSGDIATLTRLLANDAKVVTDGGGKVSAALNVIAGADRAAAFLAGVVRKGWTDEMTVRFGATNGLPGFIVSGPRGLVQTTAFELEGDVIKAIYVVRNPDKLGHLTPS